MLAGDSVVDPLLASGPRDVFASALALIKSGEAGLRAAKAILANPPKAAVTPLKDVTVDAVFMGSCTNSRIEDLRAFASVIEGRQKADNVRVMVVPGSAQVKAQAEQEGLDQVFTESGFEWRDAGCSMCLGMNPDILSEGERSASTSNRNFEGRQGKGSRTFLASPLTAAATAVSGVVTDPRPLVAR